MRKRELHTNVKDSSAATKFRSRPPTGGRVRRLVDVRINFAKNKFGYLVRSPINSGNYDSVANTAAKTY